MWRLGGILCLAASVWGADSSTAQVRNAATKAVTLIQASQKSWFSKTDCSSCHDQALPALAFREARARGIAVDEALAHADAIHAFGVFSNLDRAIQYTHVIDPALDDGYHLLAADAAGVRPSVVTAVYARHLAARQQPDGHWATEDTRPPQAYGNITATAVVLDAIQTYAHPSLAAETRERVERARAWLLAQTPHNTEERAYQLIGLSLAGAETSQLSKFAKGLKETQQSDGGWNSLDGLASDAYSTGEALVALHNAGGVSIDDPAWSRGIRFLLDSQQPDGSWHVHTRLHPPPDNGPPYFETGFPYGHDQFISTAGTAWAATALAVALEPSRKVETPELHEAMPAAVEPWVETVLFGTTEDVRALLDKGFDPNSATKAGTTALMMAVPNLEKTKLLFEHGAKINARSKNRYSALLVAAIYPGSSPVLRYLLDHGAEVRLQKGEGTPQFNATALGRAAYSGNAEAIPWFLAKGDKFDDRFIYLGLFPGIMVTDPFSFGDTRTAQALLDAGLNVEFPDPGGVTLLDTAVIGNQIETARLLIARGANVNVVDKLGMTPLLYAVRADYGDSAMIELLLKSGADPKIANIDGETPLNLARKYQHSHLIPALIAAEPVVR